jgi:hypothetical protein
MLLERLHEQYEDTEERLVLFECEECGFTSMSIGTAHAHIERHRGYTRFNIQLPFTKTAMANVDELMKLTNVYAVDGRESINLDAVEGL